MMRNIRIFNNFAKSSHQKEYFLNRFFFSDKPNQNKNPQESGQENVKQTKNDQKNEQPKKMFNFTASDNQQNKPPQKKDHQKDQKQFSEKKNYQQKDNKQSKSSTMFGQRKEKTDQFEAQRAENTPPERILFGSKRDEASSIKDQSLQTGIFLKMIEKEDQSYKNKKNQTVEVKQIDVEAIENQQLDAKNSTSLISQFYELQQYEKVCELFKQVNDEKITINQSILNMGFASVIQLDFEEANEFYRNLLINEQKFKFVYPHIMDKYLSSIIYSNMNNLDRCEQLEEFLSLLKKNEYDIKEFDLFCFKQYLCNNVNNIHEEGFLKNIELLCEYLNYYVECKGEIDELFYEQINFKKIFKNLVDYEYPSIKKNKKDVDLCHLLQETLIQANIYNSNYIDFNDVAKWISIYFENQSKDNCRFIITACKHIPDHLQKSFMIYFKESIKNFIKKDGQVPFSSQVIEQAYQQVMKNQSHSFGIVQLNVILELASSCQNYKIIFNIYENYKALTGKEKNAYVFERFIETLCQMEFNEGCNTNIQQVLDEIKKTSVYIDYKVSHISLVKSLIKDKDYDQAFTAFENSFLMKNIIKFQRQKIRIFLISLIDSQQTETGGAESFIGRFVNKIHKDQLYQMYQNELIVNATLDKCIFEENIHKYLDNQLHKNNFLNVHRRVCRGELDPKVTQELKDYKDQLHYDEINILKNYDKLLAQHQKEKKIKELVIECVYKKNIYDLDIEEINDNLKISEEGKARRIKIITDKFEISNKEKLDAIKRANDGKNVSMTEKIDNKKLRAIGQQNYIRETEVDYIGKVFKPRFLDNTIFEELKLMFEEEYELATNLVKLSTNESQDYMWDFIMWGVQNKEPIAINMAEKYAEVLGIQIPDHVASQVSLFFNYTSNVSESLTEKHNKSMELIGSISRGKIYDSNGNFNHYQYDEESISLACELSQVPILKSKAENFLAQEFTAYKYYKFGVPYEVVKQNVLQREKRQFK